MTTATVPNRQPAADRRADATKTPGRWTLSGAFLGIAITALLFAHLFSGYWLILAGFAFLGFTQSWSFDLAQIEQRERCR
jgi:hypothetical protein